MAFNMTPQERDAFLKEVHVGMLSIPEPGRGPLTVPVWYDYTPEGEVWFLIDRTSRKGNLLEMGTRCSLCAQEEVLPYKYVSIEGPVTAIEPGDIEHHLRPMARRYLGPEGGDAYVERTRAERAEGGSIVVRIRPERWLTVDYSKANLF
jgi:nitroimidazol reductase NimA-like FMN-containing flavoprotein (pyridoxamine 5'-phosphate oxidase superfamily)